MLRNVNIGVESLVFFLTWEVVKVDWNKIAAYNIGSELKGK